MAARTRLPVEGPWRSGQGVTDKLELLRDGV